MEHHDIDIGNSNGRKGSILLDPLHTLTFSHTHMLEQRTKTGTNTQFHVFAVAVS